MKKVSMLKTHAYYNEINIHWVCKEHLEEYIIKLSDQVRQINRIIKKLSSGVDNN